MIVPAVARQHAPQRRQRAVDAAQVRHFGHAAIIVRRHLLDRREDRAHRVVDPDVDRAETPLRPLLPPPRPGRRRPRRSGRRSPGRRALRRLACALQPARPRATRPIEAPCRANARAVARPTPAEAPVMTTTRLMDCGMCLLLSHKPNTAWRNLPDESITNQCRQRRLVVRTPQRHVPSHHVGSQGKCR